MTVNKIIAIVCAIWGLFAIGYSFTIQSKPTKYVAKFVVENRVQEKTYLVKEKVSDLQILFNAGVLYFNGNDFADKGTKVQAFQVEKIKGQSKWLFTAIGALFILLGFLFWFPPLKDILYDLD